MNYAEAIAFLDRCINYERLGFEHMTRDRHLVEFAAFLDRLGAPQNACPIIHIAGTKGKGSTALYLAAALEHNGYKTGLYTSPHIENYTERIKIGLRDVSKETFGQLLEKVVAHYPPDKRSDHAGFRTVFELLTAMAFLHFKECGVDIIILETGLGGRLDATNIVDPIVSVITTLGLEHTEILGETIEQIAAEKAGIIKPGRPVVLSCQQPQWSERVLPVITRRARELDSPLYLANANIYVFRQTESTPDIPQQLKIANFDGPGSSFTANLPLHGEHQSINLGAAMTALMLLRDAGWNLTADKIREGIESARMPGRVEVIESTPPLVLDCAHCPTSFRALIYTLDELFPQSPVILLMGLALRKRREEIFKLIFSFPRIVKVLFYPLPSPRSDDPSALATVATECGLNATACESITQCMNMALDAQVQLPGSVIVGAGSFYGMAPLRREWLRHMGMKIDQ